jgi:ribosomal protein S18 acetylase RimI-like enzyme
VRQTVADGIITRMLRPATPADRDAVIALALAEDAAWSGASPVSPEEAGEFVDGFAPGVVLVRGGAVAGYAAVSQDGQTMLLTDPGDALPAVEALVGWLGGRGRHQVDAYAADAGRIGWLEAHGFTHIRSSFELQRAVDPPPAPAVWPPGIAAGPYRRGEDDAAVHALVYVDAAWSEVPGHGEQSLAAWQAMIAPEYRGWVARRDGRAVGWVAGRVFPDGRGWIQQLAVARPLRGLGLGRALLLHALADLRAHGATALALGVEAANANALGLYRQAGFAVAREWRLYARTPA